MKNKRSKETEEIELASLMAGTHYVKTFSASSGGLSMLITKASRRAKSLELRFRLFIWNA